MRKIVPVLIAVGFVGFQVLERYMPTKERADLAEVYGVSGDETAILYNYERQEQTGIYENGQTYLPVSWINDHLNERTARKIFSYTRFRTRSSTPTRRQRDRTAHRYL